MKPQICHAMIFSLDEEEVYHDCIMHSIHQSVHVCLCGQTWKQSKR